MEVKDWTPEMNSKWQQEWIKVLDKTLKSNLTPAVRQHFERCYEIYAGTEALMFRDVELANILKKRNHMGNSEDPSKSKDVFAILLQYDKINIVDEWNRQRNN